MLFPIDSSEMTKFFLIGSIKFFVVMALTLTRDGKDAMVVAECGAEAIAFLKVSVTGWDGRDGGHDEAGDDTKWGVGGDLRVAVGPRGFVRTPRRSYTARCAPHPTHPPPHMRGC